MKFPLLSTLAICSLALAKVHASAVPSSEDAPIYPNSIPEFFADSFKISGLELVAVNAEELEWFQGLTTLSDQMNVDIALAMGLVFQKVFSNDVMKIILKHVAQSCHSFPKDIQEMVGGETLKLTLKLDDYESCATLIINNPSLFLQNQSEPEHRLTLKQFFEIFKLCSNEDLIKVLKGIFSNDPSVYFHLLYNGFYEDLFMNDFIKTIIETPRPYISNLLYDLQTAASNMHDIERFIRILENIKSDPIFIGTYYASKNLQNTIDYVVLYLEILKSSKTRVFDEVIQLFKLRISLSTNDDQDLALEFLARKLAALDLNSFLQIKESKKPLTQYLLDEKRINTLINPLTTTATANIRYYLTYIPDYYHFKSMKIDETDKKLVYFRFILRDDITFVSRSLPKEIINPVKNGRNELSHSPYISAILEAHPDLDEEIVFDFFDFIFNHFSIIYDKYELEKPSFKVMKAVAFSTRLNDCFKAKRIVFKPDIHVLSELIKYSASINSEIVLDKSVCNFYRKYANRNRDYPQFHIYKHLTSPKHFKILESLTGVSFAQAYLESVNNGHIELNEYQRIVSSIFHEYRIAFKDWFSGPERELLNEIENVELYQMILQDNDNDVIIEKDFEIISSF